MSETHEPTPASERFWSLLGFLWFVGLLLFLYFKGIPELRKGWSEFFGKASAASTASVSDTATNMAVMYFEDSGDIVVVEGRWRRVGGQRTVLIPDVNSVRIECFRAQGFCDEYIAKLITPEDDETKTTDRDSLFLMKQRFRVTEWNRRYLAARAEPRAADLLLRVSFADGVAERSARWTSARGAEVDDLSTVHNWVLSAGKPLEGLE